MVQYDFLDLIKGLTRPRPIASPLGLRSNGPPPAIDGAEPCPNPDSVQRRLDQLVELASQAQPHLFDLSVKTIGRSYQGREIRSASIGTGETKILLWSQMHGDEPTHTIVLLDLIELLMQSSGETKFAEALLSRCTLTLIPMLNPDGAVLQTRRNAQGIDINRDARLLQSPEGKILHDAVIRLRPDFGFNLHNQNARRTIAATGELSSVALLTPPPHANVTGDSEPHHLVRAKQVGSAVCVSVSGDCKNMLARYGADYMPRAFGEWVQSQGVSTLLIEAGGWPGKNDAALLDVHFRGLIGALAAIATEELPQIGAAAYEALPEGSGYDRIDCVVRDCEVRLTTAAETSKPFQTDIGINSGASADGRVGEIIDIGDLFVHDSDCDVEGNGMPCEPGGVGICESITPSNLFEPASLELLQGQLENGVTTVIGVLDQFDDTSNSPLATLSAQSLPTNIAFALRGDLHTNVNQLLSSVAFGVVLILDDSLAPSVREHAQQLGLAILPAAGDDTTMRLINWRHGQSEQFDSPFADRETVSIGSNADLVLRSGHDAHTVLVNGQVALKSGKLTGINAGRLLRRRFGPAK